MTHDVHGCQFPLIESEVDCSCSTIEHTNEPVLLQRTLTGHTAL